MNSLGSNISFCRTIDCATLNFFWIFFFEGLSINMSIYINTNLAFLKNRVQQASQHPSTSYLLSVLQNPVLNSHSIRIKHFILLYLFVLSSLLEPKQDPQLIMLYQSLALLLAFTLTSVSAIPTTQAAKRNFVNDANGNIKLTCTFSFFFWFIIILPLPSPMYIEGEEWPDGGGGERKKKKLLT